MPTSFSQFEVMAFPNSRKGFPEKKGSHGMGSRKGFPEKGSWKGKDPMGWVPGKVSWKGVPGKWFLDAYMATNGNSSAVNMYLIVINSDFMIFNGN